jgi:hypothetical protein
MNRKWVVRTSNSRLFGTAVIAEILPSWCLWVLSPTDSVRVWYPSFLSYLGEHFLPWSVVLIILLNIPAPILAGLQLSIPNFSKSEPRLLGFREYASFAGLLLASDVIASFLLIVWAQGEAFTTRLVYNRSVSDYFEFREPIFLAVLLLASIILNRPRLER